MILKSKDGQEINFEIDEKYKKIAVNCSGGADSSILLYMTVKYLIKNNRKDTKITVLTCANDKKGRWNARKAALVIDYIINKTKTNAIDTHLSYYRDVQNEKYFHEIEFELFNNKKIDLVISGVTANPSNDTYVEDINNNIINLRDEALPERDSRNQNTWNYNTNMVWYTPFVNIDKRFIAFLYNSQNVEDLLDLTRSCEGFADSTESFTKPCGTCWWCLERKWAFGKF
jgi:7-cyano-7-deazaguanine synthase in queuosine biosynthesis